MNINRQIAELVEQSNYKPICASMFDAFPVEYYIEPTQIAANNFIAIIFDDSGFNIETSTGAKSVGLEGNGKQLIASLSLMQSLLYEEYTERGCEDLELNHADIELSSMGDDPGEVFIEHVDDECPPCRETALRIKQDLEDDLLALYETEIDGIFPDIDNFLVSHIQQLKKSHAFTVATVQDHDNKCLDVSVKFDLPSHPYISDMTLYREELADLCQQLVQQCQPFDFIAQEDVDTDSMTVKLGSSKLLYWLINYGKDCKEVYIRMYLVKVLIPDASLAKIQDYIIDPPGIKRAGVGIHIRKIKHMVESLVDMIDNIFDSMN